MSEITAARILTLVAASFDLSVSDLLSTDKKSDLILPRYLAALLMRLRLKYSWPRIGRALHRAHSSVIHGVRRLENRADADPNLSGAIDAFLRTLDEMEASDVPDDSEAAPAELQAVDADA